jgi:hypothetical protein
MDRKKVKLKKFKDYFNEHQAKLCFFKWKVVVQAFKPWAKPDVRHLMKLLVNDRQEKTKNSIISKEEKYNFYKTQHEELLINHIQMTKSYNK